MSGYRNKLGPIPDHWFENETDPDAGKDMEPDGFSEKFYEKLKARLQERPEQPERSASVGEGPDDYSGLRIIFLPILFCASGKK